LFDYWIQELDLAAINAIVCLGVYLLSMTKQLSIAQAAFMGIGAYTAGVMTRELGLPFAVAMLAGGIAGALVSSLLALVVSRLRVWIFAISTLCFGEVTSNLLLNIPYLGGAQGFHAVANFTRPWTPFLILAILTCGFVRFQRSRMYYAFLATGDDEVAAQAVGINTTMARFMAFVIAGFVAGIGGGLQIHLLRGIEPDSLGFSNSFMFVIFAIVGGGERNFWGAIVGAGILTLLPEVLRFSSYERYVLYGLILVVMMIFRPRGLLWRVRLGEKSWLANRFLRASPE